MAGPSQRGPLWLPILQVAAVFVIVCTFGTVLATAGPTLGYDFRAYLDASRRILDGLPLYDSSVDVAGGFAIYLYPPPFAIALIPLALVPGTLAPMLAWEALCIAALVAGIAILPVRPWIRWTLLLLSGVTWQTFMAVKLGQDRANSPAVLRGRVEVDGSTGPARGVDGCRDARQASSRPCWCRGRSPPGGGGPPRSRSSCSAPSVSPRSWWWAPPRGPTTSPSSVA